MDFSDHMSLNFDLGSDMHSIHSNHSGGDDSSDESEFSMDYQHEKSLSTRASRVTLATLDHVSVIERICHYLLLNCLLKICECHWVRVITSSYIAFVIILFSVVHYIICPCSLCTIFCILLWFTLCLSLKCTFIIMCIA